MKKHKYVSLVVLTVALGIPFYAFAIGPTMPFGGKILQTRAPGLTCAAEYGALVIKPVNAALPGPYFIRTDISGQKSPKIGSWILGNYSVLPDSVTCYTQSVPPVPVPSFSIQLYGVSK